MKVMKVEKTKEGTFLFLCLLFQRENTHIHESDTGRATPCTKKRRFPIFIRAQSAQRVFLKCATTFARVIKTSLDQMV
jgi:hypothetical protein